MELKLIASPANESILTELYGWGEVPFDWIVERNNEYTTLAAQHKLKNNSNPIVMQSTYNGPDSSWHTLYFIPVSPTVEEHLLLLDIRSKIARMPVSMFKIVCIHDGVECHAFM